MGSRGGMGLIRLTDRLLSPLPQSFKSLTQVIRKRRFKLHPPAESRVLEPQPEGMQCLPVQQYTIVFARRFAIEVGHSQVVAAAIGLVRQYPAADAREVNADLVRSPSPRLASDESGTPEALR